MKFRGYARRAVGAVFLTLALGALAPGADAAEIETPSELVPSLFITLLGPASDERTDALRAVRTEWRDGYPAMLIEVLYFTRDPDHRRQVIELLERKTGQKHGQNLDAWYHWLWSEKRSPHASYPEFKKRLYRMIDPKFGGYFDVSRTSTIRLDEVRWGGVRQDGIPPLRGPKMIPAKNATYLADTDVVFGLVVNGDARAYPKRILAWHEMFVDDVGGVPVAGVYCTLCGSMILYETTLNGTKHELGTSGFLYRSNKLMYDKATQSLWNTLWGRPVIGPLVGKDIQLKHRSVVTTTWGEWKGRHPKSQVLSLETGHRRDYSEGAAYRDYFSSDHLMFTVPKLDERLKNKAEVLALRLDGEASHPTAISADYLLRHPVHHEQVGDTRLVVLTDPSGANRVYAAGDVRITGWDGKAKATDATGQTWRVTEDALLGAGKRRLERFPAHRAFWFGWYSAYPDTRLVR